MPLERSKGLKSRTPETNREAQGDPLKRYMWEVPHFWAPPSLSAPVLPLPLPPTPYITVVEYHTSAHIACFPARLWHPQRRIRLD